VGKENKYTQRLASDVFEKLYDQDENLIADILKFVELLNLYEQMCIKKKAMELQQEIDWPIVKGAYLD
jgi:hypothetical protein